LTLGADGAVYDQSVLDYPRLALPAGAVRDRVLADLHEQMGHPSAQKLCKMVAQRYFVPDLTTVMKQQVTDCLVCAGVRPATRPQGFNEAQDSPQGVWATVSVDIMSGLREERGGSVVPLSPEKGYSAVLVILDELSQQVHLVPTTVGATAEQTILMLERELVRLHGVPRVLRMDKGSIFTSTAMEKWCRANNVDPQVATTDHHVSTVERFIRAVREKLRATVDHNGLGWVDALAKVELALNTLPMAADGRSPYQREHGQNPRLPLLGGGAQLETPEETVQRALASAWLLDKHHARKLEVAVQHDKGRVADPLRIGDWVAVPAKLSGAAVAKFTDAVGAKGRPLYIAAYEVVADRGRGNWELKMPAAQRNDNVFHTSVLRKVGKPTDVDRLDPERPTELLWPDGAPKAKIIINSRASRGQTEFLVLFWGQTEAAGVWVRRTGLKASERRLATEFTVRQRQNVPSTMPRKGKTDPSRVPGMGAKTKP
jgi:hypothetical protein